MGAAILIPISFILYIIGFLIGNNFSEFNEIKNLQNHQNTLFVSINKLNVSLILLENLRVLMLLIFGGFILGIPTFINLFSNGYILGVIFAVYSETFGMERFLTLTLPHGIFEIPAIIIAGAAGFKIPYEIIRYLSGKKEQILTKEDIKEYLTLALISIILIVIAAWIEANITLKIAKAMLNSTKGI
ncbi:putative membrane protein [Archaeoglobus fulgidus DSM 8774]|uniref:Putative membrane protein n=2 Tax=Archaeoglobus fulgidus TaxID=2234 RepID=A0A075WDA4_ARCFL|nr:putative membrane protein [Archaeoglobus fulgidus DSM 8774]